MSKKKIISIVLAMAVVGGVSTFGVNYNTAFASKQNIKVMAYKPSGKVNEDGFQIDKFGGVESAAWLNDSEVLTLSKKSEFNNPDSARIIRYCSIYNLNTKKSKDFQDVNIDEFLGVSPDKKYVLYSEVRTIPKIGSSEWQKSLDSGDLLHKKVKLLDLSTGQITDLNTEKINSDAEFIWVGNNKILANYFEKWAIVDASGKVYADGSYNAGEHDGAWIAGVDEIKDLGNSVEGKFYYTQGTSGKEGVKLLTMDVKTKEIKSIFSNQFSLHGDKKGKTIIMDNFDNNGGKSAYGVFENRTFGALVMDESGKIQQNIKLPKGRAAGSFILSPDGTKAAYVESDNKIGTNSIDDTNISIKVVDTKTGNIKEVVKASSLKDKDTKIDYYTDKKIDVDGNEIGEIKRPIVPSISNICWDSTGAALSFTDGDSLRGNSEINTYIISFDK